MRDFGNASYNQFDHAAVATKRGTVLGKVLGLLTFSFLFTALGVLVGSSIGPGDFLLSIVGTFGCLIALSFLRERSPINLILLYAFSTFEGLLIAPLLDGYIAQGMGALVLNAAVATAGVTFLGAAYGYTTKRDISGIGGILFVGLLGVIIASVVGLFLQLPGLYLIISAVCVVLFTGFIVYDFNRMANLRGATEGQAIMLAVSVYLDMFNIFISLLNIMGFMSGGSGGSSRRGGGLF